MPAEIVQAQYEQLSEIAVIFANRSESIAEMQNRLQQSADLLTQGGWYGRGSAAFTAEMNAVLFPVIQRLREALQVAGSATAEVSTLLREAEENAARPFDVTGNAAAPIAQVMTVASQSNPPPNESDSMWDSFWKSLPGQQGLLTLNALWGFVAGSGNEFGESYGPGAKTGAIAGEVTSSFLVWGDIRDLIVEGYNAVHPGRDASELTAILAAAGIIGDLGWLDGPIPDPLDGVNAGAAVLKAIVKQLDEVPKPVREGMEGLIKWGIKNPSKLDDIAEVAQWTLKNHDSPVGQGVVDMLSKGAKDPDWFGKTSDIGQWLKKDPDRLGELAMDGAKKGNIDAKSLQEASVGLSVEQAGKLSPPITRDPSAAAEFIDAKGQAWDVKAFNSKFPGSFKLDREVNKIGEELRLGENIILDTTDLGPKEIAQLREAVNAKGWSAQIVWHP